MISKTRLHGIENHYKTDMFCLVQTSILNSELSETVKSIKRESSDDAVGGGVSTTMALGS